MKTIYLVEQEIEHEMCGEDVALFSCSNREQAEALIAQLKLGHDQYNQLLKDFQKNSLYGKQVRDFCESKRALKDNWTMQDYKDYNAIRHKLSPMVDKLILCYSKLLEQKYGDLRFPTYGELRFSIKEIILYD